MTKHIRAMADQWRAVGRVPEAVGLTPLFHTWQLLVERCRQTHLLPGKKEVTVTYLQGCGVRFENSTARYFSW